MVPVIYITIRSDRSALIAAIERKIYFTMPKRLRKYLYGIICAISCFLCAYFREKELYVLISFFFVWGIIVGLVVEISDGEKDDRKS